MKWEDLALVIIDGINLVLQSLVFAYVLIYCVDKKQRIDKIKLFFMTLMFIIIGTLFTGTFGDNTGIVIFSTHVLAFGLVALLYKKNIINALVAHTIIYCIIEIYFIIFGNIIFEYVKEFLPIKYINYEEIFIIHIPEWILIFLCFNYIKKIEQVYKLIVNEGLLIYLLIMSFALDFICTFYLITLGQKSQLIKNVIYIMFFLFLLVILVYFWKVNQKSEQIYKLNEALEVKNSELSQIKHDYGAQISYLYGLCLMERFDDLKRALKDIINNNEAIPTAVEVTQNENSVLSLALKPAIDKGIHVIIEDKCDFRLINMSEMEFYRVISNIVNNAIKAMKSQGIIIAKSYEYLGNAVIKIENNGPKIEEQHLNNIFKVGFTTKDNSDKNHGYGLSIVKDLVERNSGKIYVKSTDTATEFKIVLPTK
jgi:two-component system sensor histidine kinase AgrC